MSSTETLLRLPLLRIATPVLPGATLTMSITPPVRRALEAARETDGRLVLLGSGDDAIGVTARVPNVGSLPVGDPAAIVVAEQRARVVDLHDEAESSDAPVDLADVQLITDGEPTERVLAATRELRATLELIAEQRRSRRLPQLLRTAASPGALADAVALWAEFGDDDRLRVLRSVDVGDRVDAIHSWARRHLLELQVAESIRHDVSEGMDKQQREFVLRQQLDAIRKELGEGGDDDIAARYRADLDGLVATGLVPSGVTDFIAGELERFERLNPQSPDHAWTRTWLDRIFEIPWTERSDDTIDLELARSVLDDDHFGLEEVKERIVEFLATRRLRRERGLDARFDADLGAASRGHGSVMALVGPPGVGKTSLGQSIARAMGRAFVRVALGGVRDEAEIRGHRRTYVGSQPGRIARALREAGTMNPVILLDEIDKMSAGGWSGDPTAALLEVLDPAQNHTFRDHYLEVDLDLSEVVFIATANVVETIPGPLLDRMDLVRLDGYTEDEKTFIAERYLLPRQVARAGLTSDELELDREVIGGIIRGYTREAGVRSLERQLGRLVRKVTSRVATGTPTPIVIEQPELTEWLGRPKIDADIPERTSDSPSPAWVAMCCSSRPPGSRPAPTPSRV
jgi:ATP-dependent Lon protease